MVSSKCCWLPVDGLTVAGCWWRKGSLNENLNSIVGWCQVLCACGVPKNRKQIKYLVNVLKLFTEQARTVSENHFNLSTLWTARPRLRTCQPPYRFYFSHNPAKWSPPPCCHFQCNLQLCNKHTHTHTLYVWFRCGGATRDTLSFPPIYLHK